MSNDRLIPYGEWAKKTYDGPRSRGGSTTPRDYRDWAAGIPSLTPEIAARASSLAAVMKVFRDADTDKHPGGRGLAINSIETEEDMREFLAREWGAVETDEEDQYGFEDMLEERINRAVAYSDYILSQSSHPEAIGGIIRKTVVQTHIIAAQAAQAIQDQENTLKMLYIGLDME